MKSKKFIWPFIFSMLLIVTGCSAGQGNQSSESTTEMAVQDLKQGDTSTANTGESEELEESSETDDISNGQSERLVIYNASLSMEVKNYEKIEGEIEKKVDSAGGYVVNSSIYNEGENFINGNITVKIPQEQFQAFIDNVEKLGVKLLDKSINGNDVTEEYVDLESRLKAKNAVETRLLTLLDQAEKTEDLLKISADLATVQEEKEQILGRMNYLKNNIDYSTVTINLQEELVAVGSIDKQESFDTWEKAKGLFITTINSILAFFSSSIVFIIGLSPVLIPLVIVFLAWFLIRRRRKE
ncbi:DUF4349 domain-containing protein [Bacillus sp. B1-b2]|uniref:DUF4349 domain-containing protein n=1 Tax=Bacillus sp. B1-b2 TaxID=2653201 RepID=UPI001261C31E|nr:DUF4349 domain-containing protein [Bacillus sp. B1-b2]KAB7671193.1 DUF4349 domain-containing protein [Bacillus sp. B1-b2]